MKPKLHFTAPYHWINDPNGLIYYKGNYHIFYQHFPYDNKWGTMHWGHAITKDFVNFEHLPIALYPSKDFDRNGCFSGSAIEIDGQLYLYYTAIKYAKENPSNVHNQYSDDDLRASQALVVSSDGIHFDNVKNKKQIIPMIQEGFIGDYRHTRDPKVWKKGDTYYLIVGNKNAEQKGQVVLFSSKNLEEWKFETVLAENSDGKVGTMWECPDFFALDEKYFLICSPQNMKAQKYEFHNGNNSVYFVGDYDENTHTFQKEMPKTLDYGLDFYAPQTTELPDGRRILIAWMKSWDACVIPEEQKWQGMMTLPRELHYVNGKLYQKPVEELKNYRKNSCRLENQEVSGTVQFDEVKGRILDLTVEICEGVFDEFCIELAHNQEYTTSYTYYRKKQIMEVNRTYCGVTRDIICQRAWKLPEQKEPLKLRFIMDRQSTELFINDGEQVSTTAICTPMEAEEIVFCCDGTVKINVEKHELI